LVNTLNEQTIALPPALQAKVDAARAAWIAQQNTRRLWSKDAALWTDGDEGRWLGWLDIVDRELRDVAALEDFGRALRVEHITDVLLLGMGGSSLGPDVLARSLGSAPEYPKLHVLDSTDPEQVRCFENNVDLAHTLFIVASKSGTTLEPNVLMGLFFCQSDRRDWRRGGTPLRRHHRSAFAAAKDRRGERLSPRLS
jgi:transaldolase/glucose-6-phosphate isomerase